jgi:hypothetical protein
MRQFRQMILPAILSAATLAGSTASACPNCKEAVEAQTGEGAKLKDGYYYSILFMVAMPFTLLGTGAFLVTKAVKRGSLPEM